MGLSVDRGEKRYPSRDFCERVDFSVGWLGCERTVARIVVQGSIPGVGLFAKRVYTAPEQATSVWVKLCREMPRYTFTTYDPDDAVIASHTVDNIAVHYLANGITGVNVC